MGKNETPLKYAPGVEPAPDSEADPAFFEALARPGKRRITTMVDEDIYDELKRRAKDGGDGRYQTYLNTLLRDFLFGSRSDGFKATIMEELASIARRLEQLERQKSASARRKKTAGKKKASQRARA